MSGKISYKPQEDECANCPGYFAESTDERGQCAFNVQRCDTCEKFDSDVEAAKAYALDMFAGLGYVVTAWQDYPERVSGALVVAEAGRFLGLGSDSVNAFAQKGHAFTFAADLLDLGVPSPDVHNENIPYACEVRIERVENGTA